MRAVVASPWPLYVRVLMKDALSWRSSVDASLLVLPSCVEAAVNALLNDLEHQLGVVLVSHALAFITAVPHGLCEVSPTPSLFARLIHSRITHLFPHLFICLFICEVPLYRRCCSISAAHAKMGVGQKHNKNVKNGKTRFRPGERRDDMCPLPMAVRSKNRGGSRSVRGRVRSPQSLVADGG